MPTRNPQRTENTTLQVANESGRQKRGSILVRRPRPKRVLKPIFLNCALAIVLCGFSQAAPNLTLSSTGISAGSGPAAYKSSLGTTVDALAVNAAPLGVTAAAQSSPGGALYYMPITATLKTTPGNTTAYLTAYVSTNFSHPASLVIYACPSTGSCSSATSGYSALSTMSGAPTSLVASPGVANGTNVTIGVALWVPDNNGSAWTGSDSATATITFTLVGRKNNGMTNTEETDTLTVNNSGSTKLEEAVSMNLAASTGLGISGGTMSFNPVDGLGIGHPAGTSIVTVAGGVIYTTPYLYNVIFTDFNSTGAKIQVYVSTTFTNPILALDDSATAGGPYSAIPTTLATAVTIDPGAASRAAATQRYLGLYLCNLGTCTNTLTGNFNATLTYVMTVN